MAKVTVTPQVSPALRMKSSTQFSIHEDMDDAQKSSSSPQDPTLASTVNVTDGTVPLVSAKLGNVQSPTSRSVSAVKLKADHALPSSEVENNNVSMDLLLAKLSEQQMLLEKQKSALDSGVSSSAHPSKEASSSSPAPLRPTTESTAQTAAPNNTEGEKPAEVGLSETKRLQKELDAAKDQIARQEQELSQTRIMKHVLEQAKAGTSIPPMGDKSDSVDRTIFNLQDAFSASRPMQPYGNHDDARSDISEALSTGTFNNRGPGNWTNSGPPRFNDGSGSSSKIWNQGSGRSWMNRPMPQMLPPMVVPQQQQMRAFSGSTSPVLGPNGKFFNDANQYPGNNGVRQAAIPNNRSGQSYGRNRNNTWESLGSSSEGSSMMGVNSGSYQTTGMLQPPIGYQPRPIGTPLSPTAAEFTTSNPGGPWNFTQPSSPGQTYVSPMEPLNYRRLLDRSVTCNWKYIVDKIVCNNDQQASIFLQQKLKVGTAEQKFEIVEAIVAQAYPLMVNRFGNFLVQRCFEHGTPEQVVAIANAIRGNTLSLSMDAFGCHVVQKAFDAVPEEYKAIMVHELLRRIPETVIHRYACHVWQKLFELRWSDSPPQIMKYVNEALRGMWHEVALGETGSLVVQNIFENCLEEDKRPCIDEVLQSIDIVAHGQFGNWCIQHICEHGAPADRSRAIDHVLRYATEYSMDQFASKVVEKCLKIGGTEFLDRYLDRVCEGRPDRPRIPLIDISSDQYGNYLIQYILTHASTQHREIVASHIRKHMVSLRGSKFGSRVGLLCCNPAYATRPGPAVGVSTNRFNGNGNANGPGNRFGGQFR